MLHIHCPHGMSWNNKKKIFKKTFSFSLLSLNLKEKSIFGPFEGVKKDGFEVIIKNYPFYVFEMNIG